MKLTKILRATAVAALALMAFAGTASATTLETNGVKQTGEIELRGSLKPGTSESLKFTEGGFFSLNTCTASTVIGKDSTAKTGAAVSGPLSLLAFTSCRHEKVVVHKPGSLIIEWIKGTTNGTVRSSAAEVTVPTEFFPGSTTVVTCTTNATDLGTITGVASGSATIDINALINCGFVLPCVRWEGTYVITTSTGGAHAIGVVE
jgi:hypothetical protein